MTTLKMSNTSLSKQKVDGVIIVGVLVESSQGPELTLLAAGLPPALETVVSASATALLAGMTLHPGRSFVPPCDPLVLPALADISAPVTVVAVAASTDPEAVRRAAGLAARTIPRAQRLAIADTGTLETSIAAVEGAALGGYRYTHYLSGEQQQLQHVILCRTESSEAALRRGLAHSEVVLSAVCAARDLVNASPSDLSPARFAEIVEAEAAELPIKIEVLNEKKLARGGYGGIMAVGQGSSRPPRLVRMSYRPRKATHHVVLVGKGITFDSGGLSLKTGAGMMTMKSDMAGAAAAAEATIAIAALKLPVAITTYLTLAENMPSATAQRPGDVITMFNGTTVEVLNTDAEGRLVMADALARSAEDEPDLLIDVATLTGAQIVALGYETAAAMANNDDVRQEIVDVAQRVGESVWPMPLPASLRPSLDSKVADIANIGERMGGMLTAGLFLAEFVPPDVPWVHLDIAGPSFNDGPPRDYCPPGGTGVIVRTLIGLAEEYADR